MIPRPTEPVREGTAVQLARAAYFSLCDNPQSDELVSLGLWLLGDVGGASAAYALWRDLEGDLIRLWHLITDDWDDGDLDELPESVAERMAGVPSMWLLEARHEATRDRLICQVHTRVWAARYRARETARTAERKAHQAAVDAAIHPGGDAA